MYLHSLICFIWSYIFVMVTMIWYLCSLYYLRLLINMLIIPSNLNIDRHPIYAISLDMIVIITDTLCICLMVVIFHFECVNWLKCKLTIDWVRYFTYFFVHCISISESSRYQLYDYITVLYIIIYNVT
jgi:hypothetical protein